jgi:hypothetical protein
MADQAAGTQRAIDALTALIRRMQPGDDPRAVAAAFIQQLKGHGWRPPEPTGRAWRQPRHTLPDERVTAHATAARALLTRKRNGAPQ